MLFLTDLLRRSAVLLAVAAMAGGSLAALSGLPGRRIYIHINNTNPIHVGGSAERRKVEAAGWEVAADGMEIVL